MNLKNNSWSISVGLMSLLSANGGLAIADTQFNRIPIHIPIPIVMAPREIPCDQALKPYFDWASGATPGREDRRGVYFLLVYNQSRNPTTPGVDARSNLAGFTAGGLSYQGKVLQGDAVATFSDRTFCPGPTSGICLPTAPFNPNAVDQQGITLTEDGTLTTVLKSWGNSTYTDRLVCLDNGVFYAPSKAGQKSVSVITLQKTGLQSPR